MFGPAAIIEQVSFSPQHASRDDRPALWAGPAVRPCFATQGEKFVDDRSCTSDRHSGNGLDSAVERSQSAAARPFAAPAAPADILEALRRAVGLAWPAATMTVREPAPPPFEEPPGDFARRIESNLAFLRAAARRWCP